MLAFKLALSVKHEAGIIYWFHDKRISKEKTGLETSNGSTKDYH